MNDAPRPLLTTGQVAAWLRLDPSSVTRAATDGRLPGATKLLGRWRFDPDEVERWIAAGRPTTTQTTGTARVLEPARGAPKADTHRRAEAAPSNPPLLVPIFKDAPWRGVHDLPSERQERPAARRRARTTRAAVLR